MSNHSKSFRCLRYTTIFLMFPANELVVPAKVEVCISYVSLDPRLSNHSKYFSFRCLRYNIISIVSGESKIQIPGNIQQETLISFFHSIISLWRPYYLVFCLFVNFFFFISRTWTCKRGRVPSTKTETKTMSSL